MFHFIGIDTAAAILWFNKAGIWPHILPVIIDRRRRFQTTGEEKIRCIVFIPAQSHLIRAADHDPDTGLFKPFPVLRQHHQIRIDCRNDQIDMVLPADLQQLRNIVLILHGTYLPAIITESQCRSSPRHICTI